MENTKNRKMTRNEIAEKKKIDKNKKVATKIRKELNSTLNWMDIRSVEADRIVLQRNKKKVFIRGIKLKPHNIFLDDEADQAQWCENIRFALNQLQCDLWFGFVYSPVNLDAYLNQLNGELAIEEDATCQEMINVDMKKAYTFQKTHKEKEFFLMIRDEDEKRLYKNLEDLKSSWFNAGFEPQELNQRDYYSYITFVFENNLINDYVFSRGLFSYLNVTQEYDAVNDQYVTIDRTTDFREYGEPIYNVRHDANLIQRSKLAPVGLKINRNFVEMGDKYFKTILAVGLPPVYALAILTQYLNDPNIKLFMNLKRCDYDMAKMLNKDYKEKLERLRRCNDATEAERIKQDLISQKQYINDVVAKNDITHNVTITFRVSADSVKEMNERVKRLKDRLSTEGWKVNLGNGLQEQLLKNATPLFIDDGLVPVIRDNVGVPLTSEAVAGLYPFIFETLYDKKGILLGEELQNLGKIVINPYYYLEEHNLASYNNRINGNFVIIGQAGSGKTTATNLMIRHCIKGKKLTVWIDPENKNEALTKRYGGTYIDWGKRGNIINPFDLKPISFDEDEETTDEEKWDTDLAIKNVTEDIKQIFQYLFPSIEEDALAIIGNIVKGAYALVGIQPDENGKYPTFKNLTYEDMPTFSTFYETIQISIKELSNEGGSDDVIRILRSLAVKMNSILNEWSVYFNGHTTIKINETDRNIISFGTKKLQTVSEQLQNALYHIMFNYSWTLCLDESVESAFIVDEAHTIILKGKISSLLSQFVRRSRKYRNAMFIITQEPRDFADDRTLTDGKAIFNNSAYKLVLGLRKDAVSELQKLERLNETECMWISRFTQGCALLIAGDRRIPIHVIATKDELLEIGAMFS